MFIFANIILLYEYIFSVRSVAEKFDLGKSSLHHCFVRVIEVLNHLAPAIIKWPTLNEIERINLSFHDLPGAIACIDGMYVQIPAPSRDPQSYVCRKLFTAETLQAICIPSLKFIDCFAGFPSSAHDSRIFRSSDIFQLIHDNPRKYFPNDEFILGDKAYPL